jgi:hypothetical protein
LEHLVQGINWPVIFYICFGLFVLHMLHNVLNLSFAHFLREIFREFQLLLRRGPINRAKINALLISGLICLCAFYLFVDPIRHLIDLANKLQEAEKADNTYVAIVAFFMICVTGILSVLALGE